MELWHQLSNAADLLGVERQLTKNQEIWEAEYNKFVNELSVFVNKGLNDFQSSNALTSGSAQATSQQMDRVKYQMTSIHSELQEPINRAVQEAKTKLRTEFVAMLNRNVVSLEEHVEAKANEIRQDTASTLEELKSTMVVVHESQERMWRAIDSMSKEVQELVQRDTSTTGGEKTEPMPVLVNLAEQEPALEAESSIAPTSPSYENGSIHLEDCWNSRNRRGNSQCGGLCYLRAACPRTRRECGG